MLKAEALFDLGHDSAPGTTRNEGDVRQRRVYSRVHFVQMRQPDEKRRQAPLQHPTTILVRGIELAGSPS